MEEARVLREAFYRQEQEAQGLGAKAAKEAPKDSGNEELLKKGTAVLRALRFFFVLILSSDLLKKPSAY